MVRQRRGDNPRSLLFLVLRHQSRVAVCILRVEAESARLVITMTVNRDIATSATQPITRFTETGSAAAAVTEFLKSFTGGQKPA